MQVQWPSAVTGRLAGGRRWGVTGEEHDEYATPLINVCTQVKSVF